MRTVGGRSVARGAKGQGAEAKVRRYDSSACDITGGPVGGAACVACVAGMGAEVDLPETDRWPLLSGFEYLRG
jgi:hypothetical protein